MYLHTEQIKSFGFQLLKYSDSPNPNFKIEIRILPNPKLKLRLGFGRSLLETYNLLHINYQVKQLIEHLFYFKL